MSFKVSAPILWRAIHIGTSCALGLAAIIADASRAERRAEKGGKRASVSQVALQRNVGHSRPWFFRKLCTMPDRNDPNHIAFYSVKEAVWRYDYLSIGKLCRPGIISP